MLIFNISFPNFIKFPYVRDTLERRVWGEKKPKYKVILQIILVFTLTRPCLDLLRRVSVFGNIYNGLM
jgi:hypothetical protein